MMKRGDYALELSTPIRHVATMIGDALGSVSIQEMAATYKALQNGDLHRIKHNEKLGSDAEAVEWLMEYAVERIMKSGKKGMRGKDQIVKDDNGYRLADGMTADDLVYEGKAICGEEYDKHKLLRDPFNPLSGIFSENIRAKGKDDITELVESIEALGYVPDTGIVKDERGVVISGHRRLAALKQASVDPTPYITRKYFGDGDTADVERLKLAISLNTGQKGFSAADRKRIAEYLYKSTDWSIKKIGELLKMSPVTIGVDLRGVPRRAMVDVNGQRRISSNLHDDIKPMVLERLEQGASQHELARKYGVHQTTISKWDKQRKLGGLSVRDKRSNLSRSSKIPEDQLQGFFKLVFDEGVPQREAYEKVSGKPTQNGGAFPHEWRDALNKEIGRREALAHVEQPALPVTAPKPTLDAETATLLDWVDANRDSDVTGLDAPAPTEQPYSKQCVCPHCGAAHERGR